MRNLVTASVLLALMGGCLTLKVEKGAVSLLPDGFAPVPSKAGEKEDLPVASPPVQQSPPPPLLEDTRLWAIIGTVVASAGGLWADRKLGQRRGSYGKNGS